MLYSAVDATCAGAIYVGNPIGDTVRHLSAVGEGGANTGALDHAHYAIVIVKNDLSGLVPDVVTALKHDFLGAF